ncbi:MAG: Uma2 family endonuclease [Pirellulaceae bacterium]|nr:Uma2 family endonuclease [Pirellulaceae bacterium]
MSSAERPEYFTVDEYLSLEDQGRSKSEYVDGWIRAMSGSTLRHNRVKLNCLVQLSLKLRGHPCQPFDSDTRVRIDQEGKKRFYYPDAQVVCDSNELISVFQDRPVLIIEVLSPSTRRYDLDEKMTAYLSIPSLQCYLVLEQHQPITIVMRRTNGGFLRDDVQGIEATIDLPFLGCSLAMSDIYDGIEFTADCVQEPEEEYEVF